MYRLGDLDFMREALRLAAEGVALASPNPLVGAVVVQNGEIVGRGVHLYARRDHAEVVALAEAGERARGATLYVNLEPCCHQGRTPPCTEAILAAGIARVVAGMRDPNPKVAGQGLQRLEAAGVSVECGCLERDALRLNEAFTKWISTGLPFVTLKAAVSLDGRIAPRPAAAEAAASTSERTAAEWISSQPARERVQELRHQSDAVLTAVGTVLADNPLLTDRTRRPRRRPLLRVVLDTHLRLAPPAAILKNARRNHDLLVLHVDGDPLRQQALEKAGARVEAQPANPQGQVELEAALRRLGDEKILSVLLEAGSRLNASMLAAGMVDKLVLFQAPRLLGGGAMPLAGEREHAIWPRVRTPLVTEMVGPDLMIEAYLGGQ